MYRAIAFVCFGLAGCVSQPTAPPTVYRYSHSSATQEQFLKERYECLQQSQTTSSWQAANGNSTDCSMYTSCMAARGYTLDPNGKLAAPPELTVNCAH